MIRWFIRPGRTICGAGIASLALLAGQVGPARAQEKPPLRLGALLPLTGVGATIGLAAQAGIELAVKDMNANGGIAGRQVKLIMADDQSDPTQDVSEFKRLTNQEHIEVLMGPLASQDTLAVLPLLTAAKMLNVTASGSDLLTPEMGPYHFSIDYSAGSQAATMADYVENTLHAKSAALIGDNGGQAKSGLAALKQVLEARKIRVTGQQEYPYRATDMSAQLLSLQNGKPDVLLAFVSSGDDTATLLKGLDDIGWTVPMVGNGTMGMDMRRAIDIGGEESVKNVTALNYKSFTYCSLSEHTKYGAFVDRLHREMPDKAAKLLLSEIALAYDSVFMAKAAIEATGTTDGPTLAHWFEQNITSFSNVTTGYSASPQTHFLAGRDALATTIADTTRPDGVNKRIGCG